jgi:hypothetical protein
VEPGRRDERDESAQERERVEVEVDGDGAVTERLLEGDAHQAVGARQEPLVGQRRAQDVLKQGFAAALVEGSGARRGVQAEAAFAHAEGRFDDNAGAAREGELARLATKLGAGWREAGDGCGGELRQGGVPPGELFGDGQHVAVSVRVEGDDAPLLEVTHDAGASDLEGVGHIGGGEARQGAELRRAV